MNAQVILISSYLPKVRAVNLQHFQHRKLLQSNRRPDIATAKMLPGSCVLSPGSLPALAISFCICIVKIVGIRNDKTDPF